NNDETTPGNNEYYGTDGSGTRGYQGLLAAMERLIPGISEIDSIVEGGGVMRFYYPDRYYDIYAPVTGDTSNWYFSMIGGDDANDGHTTATPKQTFPHLLTLDLDPRDSVFFNKGDTWRLTADGDMSWRGAEGNHITFTSYGTGDKPRILGSDTTTAWTDEGLDVWSSNSTFAGSFDPSGDDDNIWFIELDDSIKWGKYEAGGTGNVDEPYDFYYNAGTDILYVYSTDNPATEFASVEVPIIKNVIELQCASDSAEYYTFDGWEIAFYDDKAFRNDYPGGINGQTRQVRGVEIRNCEIHHCGDGNDNGDGDGIFLLYSDVIIENNEIHNTGRHGAQVSLWAMYQDTISNYLVQDNYFHDGYHTTGFDIIIYSDNGTNYVIDSVVVRRNIIDGSFGEIEGAGSNLMYLASEGADAVTLENVWIYNNLFKGAKKSGLQFASNCAGGVFDDIYIHNNVFFDFHIDNTNNSLIVLDSSNGAFTDTYIRNNIIYSASDN
ncbi:hypothetical protein LCGC14_2515070, partial [marine sediment metagenome]